MSAAAKPIAFDEVQANILLPYARANCGRMICVRFDAARPGDAAALAPARAWLDAMRALVTFHAAVRDARGQSIEQGAGPWFNIGITHEGLQALGFDPFTRNYMPTAFREGMQRRRDRLGDGSVESAKADEPIHAIVLCYACDPTVEGHARKVGVAAHEWLPLDVDEIKDLEYAVNSALEKPLGQLPQIDGVQYLRGLEHDVYRLSAGDVVGLEYFGFRDGVAQPRLFGVPSDHPSPMDTVPGSVLLGYPSPEQPAGEVEARAGETREQLALEHLKHGSFLVVRHLVQDIETFRTEVATKASAIADLRATELAEYMMGRRRDGQPLFATRGAGLDDFTYDDDPDGQRCPFHAHARRVNPRDERSPTRRLMRRGLPTSGYRYKRDERGLLFMAYNTDIESQFEFVQRQWVNAGAESHGLSSDRDPIAADVAMLRGVRQDGGTFSFVSATTDSRHAVTSLQSCVQARWGAYAVVPSRSTLAELAADPKTPIAEYQRRVAAIDDPVLRRDILGRWLDDPDMGRRIFAEVREHGGVVRIERDHVVLVGSAELVAQVAHDDGKVYSVERQGEAMRQTTGAFYLGMDAYKPEYQLDSQASCALIPGWKQQLALWNAKAEARAAIKAAQTEELARVRAAVGGLCQVFISLSMTKALADHQTPDTPLRGEIVLAEFTAFVLAGLTPKLFGVPQPSARATIGLNVPPSGYTFFAFPDAAYTELAEQASRGVRGYLARLIEDRARRRDNGVFPPHQDNVGGKPPACPYVAPNQEPDLSWQATLDATLLRLEQMFESQQRECTVEDRVRLLAGVISGMLITSFKLFTDGVTDYARTIPVGTTIEVDAATATRLAFRSMKQNERSMPNIIYRRVVAPTTLGSARLATGDVVLASQGSAMAESEDDWFYGDRGPTDAERPQSPHFCPGYLVANAIIETMSVVLLSKLPGLRRKSADGEPLALTYDWAQLKAQLKAQLATAASH